MRLNDDEIVDDIDKAPLCNDKNIDKKQQKEENVIKNDQRIDGNDISSSSSSGSCHIVMNNAKKLENFRKKISENIEKEAMKMIDNDDKKDCFSELILKPDTIVSVKIPKWDKQHKLNFDCLLCRVIEYFPDIKKYKLASLESDIIIKNLFSPRQLKECKNYTSNMIPERINHNRTELPLRSVVIKEQDMFIYCKCISDCNSLKCRCKQAKRKCVAGLCHVSKKNNKCINR